MFDNIIAYSIKNKFVIGLFVLVLIVWGIFSLRDLPIDAVPDITNNQVQVITTSPTLATQEVEKFITTPVELSLQNIQQLVEIRSISRFGISVVTIVFEENMDLYLARQLVGEHIKIAKENIPEGLGNPEMAPISTGLGEVYQYVIYPDTSHEDNYSLSDLRTIQDWIVKRQLSGLEGVVEVNTLGGYLKQYEVAVDPELLKSVGISITDIYDALSHSNENTGGAYIEKNPNTYYIRTNGIVKSLEDIENIVVMTRNGIPVLITDVATVQFGKAPRYGALTKDGKEAVGGTVMMLKGANSAAVVGRVKDRVSQIQKTLPEGIIIEAYLDRDKLVSTAIGTVKKNLIEGGLIVIFILVLMLGNWRAGLIVASVIPLSMLFAVSMMRQLGISANLMSLGAIDFGLIVDGAVIIVEAIVHRLQIGYAGQKLSKMKMNEEVLAASKNIRNSAAFGEIILLMVYIPILALVGIEGKMFRPMAQTVMLAISGALILSLTYVPMMAALFLNRTITDKRTIADRIITFFQKMYAPLLNLALQFKRLIVISILVLLAYSLFVFSRMGGEFIPILEEGDLALHQILPPGSSLSHSIDISKIIQRKLISEFPEVIDVVTKMGSAEIPTDPMPVETGDIIVIMKPKSEWTSAKSKQEIFEKMEKSLRAIPGMNYEFSQPIQMRFNELMTGSRADVAIKLYGEDLDILYEKGKEAEKIIGELGGISSVKVEQTVGMPQISVNYLYPKMAQYGLQVKDVNRVVKTAFAGEKAGTIYEDDKTFDLVVRMKKDYRTDIGNVEDLFITLDNGIQVPLTEVATVGFEDAPMQISRDDTKRRIVIGVNIGNTDVTSLVANIQEVLDRKMQLPPGYYFTYGGQFENFQAAKTRLSVVVPMALGLIFVLLYFTFNSFSQALLIFSAIPLSAIGGIWALQLRGLPFSISAGIGFIALFGVSVLNGIVLIGYFNQLKKEGISDLRERIFKGSSVRLRPVLMTAAVASFGFLPMALSTSGGAEVQRPLATVVIGGLITATFLTLFILPILYYWLERWSERRNLSSRLKMATLPFVAAMVLGLSTHGQNRAITLDQAIELAVNNHPSVKTATLAIEKNRSLQGFKYNLGPTTIRYQGDGLFSDNPQKVNQFEFIQNFPSPSATKAHNNYQRELLLQSELDRDVIEYELSYQVSDIYHDIQYYKRSQSLYDSLIVMYTEFHRMAKVRHELGEINGIEPLSLLSQLREYDLLRRQDSINRIHLENTLQFVMGSTERVTTAGEFSPLDFEDGQLKENAWLIKCRQEMAVEQSKIGLLQSHTKPSYEFGYSAQNYFDSGWLSGVQAGIQIPFFNNQINKKVSAQKREVAIADQRYEEKIYDYNQQLQHVRNTIVLHKQGMEFYKGQLETINREMVKISQLNYQAGEMSYLELLNALRSLSDNNKKYVDQIYAYNKAIIFFNYLMNK